MSHRARSTSDALWTTCAIVAFLLAGCLLATPAVAQPDAWITAKTKLALLTTDGVHATDVNVDTVNGQVTLHGKVRSGDEKDKAQMVAEKIDGVQSVRNLLQVVPARRETVVTIGGKREKLAGILQQKYGIAKEEAEKQIAQFERTLDRAA